jgi:hypothetical protein
MRPLLLLLLLLPAGASEQGSADEDAVRAHVLQLFDAMRAYDADGVRGHFHETASLYSVSRNRADEVVVTVGDLVAFADAVGGEHPLFDEHLGPIEVRLDGDLATAYMPYAFFLGDRFSHCGVNAFHLVRAGPGWRTIHITDTRRTSDCHPSVAPAGD